MTTVPLADQRLTAPAPNGTTRPPSAAPALPQVHAVQDRVDLGEGFELDLRTRLKHVDDQLAEATRQQELLGAKLLQLRRTKTGLEAAREAFRRRAGKSASGRSTTPSPAW